jgi:uncharacterized FlgJ-related protein
MRILLFTILLNILTIIETKATEDSSNNNISKIHLYNKIIESGVKFPDIVYAQAILESGNFKSRIFKKNNNLFGMKVPRQRKTNAVGKSKKGYAVYIHWIDSVNDYLEWQMYHLKKHKILTRTDYLSLLNRIYCTNDNYVNLLKPIFKNFQKLKKQQS